MDRLKTLGDLGRRLAGRGDAPAVIAHRRGEPLVWSAGKLDAVSRAVASGLRAAGVPEREPVALLAPNSPEWLAALLGIVGARALAVPVSDQITNDELERVLSHSDARWLFTVAKHLPRLAGLPDARRLRVVLLDDADVDAGATCELDIRGLGEIQDSTAPDLPKPAPDDLAFLLFTSGTTGTPKGVPLTHANLCANIDALLAERIAGPDDRALLPLPFHHAYPLTVGLLTALATGTTIVIPAGLTGPQIAAALNGSACTIVLGVPRLYEALLEGLERRLRGRAGLLLLPFRGLLALSSALRRRFGLRVDALPLAPLRRRLGPELRLLVSGGARLDPRVADRLEGLGFDVLTGYGLTETSPILTFNPPGRARLGTDGLAVPGVELRIDRARGRGDGSGEILARGPSVFAGYWRNEEATRESFTEDGFYRTGDLGFLDADGYLHIVGRSKELIVLAAGENVVPEDVEAVLARSAILAEVAVLERDGRLVALVVPDRKAAAGHDGLDARVRAEIRRAAARLPSYQRPTDLAVTMAALPRTQIGKLRRHELPELFARAGEGREGVPAATLGESDRALIETPPNDRLWRWLGGRFPDRHLTPDTDPDLDLGIDSLGWMTLTMEMEERFRIHLEADAVSRIETLRDLLHEVLQAGPAEEGAGRIELAPGDLRLVEPPGFVPRTLAPFLSGLDRALVRSLFRLRVAGLEHLPAHGPLLITPNHASYLDPFVLAAALPAATLRRTWWAGTTDILFRGPLSRRFSRMTRVIPVDPGRGGVWTALGLGRVILERGERLVWFPEGRRSRSGELQAFQPGVAWLIERTGVATLPVLIEGTHAALPPGRWWPRLTPIRIRFGKPIPAQELADRAGGDRDHGAQADVLRRRMAALAERPPP